MRRPDREAVPYDPWLDDCAVADDLEPDGMPHRALTGPHRVVNRRIGP